ncbi:HpcH/HpaI aldolase/citrate lyase family protein [Variovorax ginsengisoli]|uniref:CoA ester lyase n=1 Tax=Variovorax ginsengisoli TaxID=363844 RepID=A0ABT8S929_9BURK|nr:CoA ester lyase [Variovorax ginsengisoli]MDN8615644.1 CoA ester lyase [Variovorax ginsengisoli]MDO1534814.1 CoA ester lyase [Variovorax ginsengisoli]
MSATVIEPTRPRLQRSQLAVPASNPAFFEKAARSRADVIFLDLEDAVAPSEKVQARKNAMEALNDIDWGDKTLQVRVNGLDTEYMYRDVIDLVEGCPRLDMLLLPKIGVASDVYAVDLLVTQVELAKKRTKKIGFDLLIETALGMANVEAIAASSSRIEALSFGVGDFAASTRARSTSIGGTIPEYGVLSGSPSDKARSFYLADVWQYAQSRVLVACRAYGLRPVDGPYGDYSDPAGFNAAARRAAALGYEGKWAIHPSQVDLANNVFSPDGQEIAMASRIMDAMTVAQREGRGAVSLDGKLIDIASIKMAESLLNKAAQLRAHS